MNVVHANVDILSTAVLKMLAALLQKSVKYSNSVMERNYLHSNSIAASSILSMEI